MYTARRQQTGTQAHTATAESILVGLIQRWHALQDQREEAALMVMRREERARVAFRFSGSNEYYGEASLAGDWNAHVEHLTGIVETLELVLEDIDRQYPELRVWYAMLGESIGGPP